MVNRAKLSNTIWRTVVVAGAMLGGPALTACGGADTKPATMPAESTETTHGTPAADPAAPEPAVAEPTSADQSGAAESARAAEDAKAAADAKAVADARA